jgi:protoheme IX farnesyltransferase
MVMVSMACGALLAPGPIRLLKLCGALLATAFVVGAANALNMVLERHADAAMERTRTRPLPTGRISPEVALGFGVLAACVGVTLLAFVANALTALLAAAALLIYVLGYTPLKRVSHLALQVGAVPGAIPPLLGWSSVTGSLTASSFTLFLILYTWQLPHFLAIAIFRLRDYERAGVRVLPAVRGVNAAARSILFYQVLLLVVSWLPGLVGLGGRAYLASATLLGVVFLCFGVFGRRGSESVWARRLFVASLVYLVGLLGSLVLCWYWFRGLPSLV